MLQFFAHSLGSGNMALEQAHNHSSVAYILETLRLEVKKSHNCIGLMLKNCKLALLIPEVAFSSVCHMTEL